MCSNNSDIAATTKATATPAIFKIGIRIRTAQSGMLIIKDIRLSKNGTKVLPEAYSTVDNMLQQGSKTKRGLERASIWEYASEENISLVICLLKIKVKKHKGTETDSIILIIFANVKESISSLPSAKHFAAIGKKETEKALKSPVGKCIIVSA